MVFWGGGHPSALRYFFSWAPVALVFSSGGLPTSRQAIGPIRRKKKNNLAACWNAPVDEFAGRQDRRRDWQPVILALPPLRGAAPLLPVQEDVRHAH